MAPDDNKHDHQRIVEKLEGMNTGIRESLKAIHEDIRKVLVEVNGKYDALRDELNKERILRTQLEGRVKLVEKTTGNNEGLWNKVIYTGIGAVVLAVLAGMAKIGGVF